MRFERLVGMSLNYLPGFGGYFAAGVTVTLIALAALKFCLANRNASLQNRPIVVLKKNPAESSKEALEKRYTELKIRTKSECNGLKYVRSIGNNPATAKKGIDYVQHDFSNIPCAEHSIVSFNLNGNKISIHANWVKGKHQTYICAQAPAASSQNKCDERFEHFWKMAYDHSQVICDLNQKNYIPKYFPTDEVPSVKYGDTVVDYIQEQQVENMKVITYKVRHKGAEKVIKRIECSDWVDKQSVSGQELRKIWGVVKMHTGDKPPIIHCRAGVGRTGTLVVAAEMIERIEGNRERWNDPDEEIDAIIVNVRKQRNEIMVQQPSQYQSLFELYNNF